MAEQVISFKDVSKTFRRPDGRGDFVAVEKLSFEIGKGEIVAVLGKTGCGKSTMFNLVAGLIEPTDGKVEVIGHDPFREFAYFRGKIGIIFQGDQVALGGGGGLRLHERATRNTPTMMKPMPVRRNAVSDSPNRYQAAKVLMAMRMITFTVTKLWMVQKILTTMFTFMVIAFMMKTMKAKTNHSVILWAIQNQNIKVRVPLFIMATT